MGKVEGMTIRHLNYLDSLVIAHSEHFLMTENGCDQTIINLNSFWFNLLLVFTLLLKVL